MRLSLFGKRNLLDGSALINQRTLRTAITHFERRRTTPQVAAQITIPELFDILYLIDLYVMCPNLTLDGTLPSDDREKLNVEIDFLGQNGLDIKPIRYAEVHDQKALGELVRSAALQAKVAIDEKKLFRGLDAPLKQEEALRTKQEIEIACGRLRASRGSSREAESINAIVAEVLSRKDIRGNKMVAGIVSLGHDGASSLLDALNSQDPSLAYGMMINRFRFYYLRHLGQHNGDVFSPGDAWRQLSQHQSLLFYTFLRDRLRGDFRDLASGGTVPNLFKRYLFSAGSNHPVQSEGVSFSSEVPFPPIGLYALITAKGNSARPLLERASELRVEFSALRGFLSKETLAAVRTSTRSKAAFDYTTDHGINKVVDQLNETFFDRYKDLSRALQERTNPNDLTSTVSKFVVPVLVNLSVSTLLTGPVFGLLGAILGSAAEGVTREAQSKFARNHIARATDQYRTLYQALFADDTLKGDIAACTEKFFNSKLQSSA